MRKPTRAAAFLTAASLFTAMSVASAADPTQADFDDCNRQAQAKGGSSAPSASPSGSGGSSVGAGGSASGSTSPSVSGSGTSVSGGTSGSVSGGAGVSASPSTSADMNLTKGMAAIGEADQAYKQAYRDCMRQRGF